MATKYISPTGNDTTGDGSLGNPWKTISKGNTGTTTNDTIYMLPGVYLLSSEAAANLTISNKTITSTVTGGAIIDGTGGWDYLFQLNGVTTLNGIIWRNWTRAGSVYLFETYYYSGDNDTATWNNCQFFNLRSGYSVPFMMYDLLGGIKIWTFNSCMFYDTYGTINIIGVTNSVNFNVYMNNCIVIFSSALLSPRLIMYVGQRLTAKNCIFVNRGPASTIGSADTTTYSCIVGFSDSAGTGNITSEPLFIDEANLNFNLRPTSPCIGTGIIP
jgi:hypothetical protein